MEVREDVAVLAGGELDSCGGVVPYEPQPFEVIGGHRLLEPLDVELLGVDARPDERFPARQRAVRAVAVALRLATDLHLHARDPLLGPAGELFCELGVGVRAEAAATVDRD